MIKNVIMYYIHVVLNKKNINEFKKNKENKTKIKLKKINILKIRKIRG